MLPKNRAEARPGTTQTTPGPEAIVVVTRAERKRSPSLRMPAAGRLGNDGFQHSRSQLSRLARVLVCG